MTETPSSMQDDPCEHWREYRRQAFREMLERRLTTPRSEYIPIEEAFRRLRELDDASGGVPSGL